MLHRSALRRAPLRETLVKFLLREGPNSGLALFSGGLTACEPGGDQQSESVWRRFLDWRREVRRTPVVPKSAEPLVSAEQEQAGYWAELRADGPVYGTGESAAYVLATYATLSPVLALRWLKSEASRIADRLDPDPERSPWVKPGMQLRTGAAPDCPGELRAWSRNTDEREEARAYLGGGYPWSVSFADVDCTYTLHVRPTGRLAERSRRSPKLLTRHRIGGLAHPLYVLNEGDSWA